MDTRRDAGAYGVAQWGLGGLPPWGLMNGDTERTFGCSSSKIDGDADERYSMVSIGTHASPSSTSLTCTNNLDVVP